LNESRITSLDSFKCLFVFAIVALHANPFYCVYGAYHFSGLARLPYYIYLISKLGVPFFFITSGFLFGRSLVKHGEVKKVFWRYFRRLFLVYLFWTIFYSFPTNSYVFNQEISQYGLFKAIFWYYLNVKHDLVLMLVTGTSGHLWFILSLMYAIAVLFLFSKVKRRRYVFYAGIILYLFIPVLSNYLGIFTKYSPYILKPLEAFAFVSFGWLMSQRKIPSLKFSVIFFISALVYYFLEQDILSNVYSVTIWEGVLGKLLAGIGTFLVIINIPKFGVSTKLPELGSYTMGIFYLHIIVMDQLLSLKAYFNSYVWDLMLPVFIYFASLGITKFLKKIPYVRELAV